MSFAYPSELPAVAAYSQSFVLDNGAFTAWRNDRPMDVGGYIKWVEEWHRHPGFDWCLIPDVIDGTEDDNRALLREWPRHLTGVPIWHLHESLDYLDEMSREWPRIAFGSSGVWSSPGTAGWWHRMAEAMSVICDSGGRPRCKLHGLRMLNPAVFSALPFSSADSTNATQNAGTLSGFGSYLPPTSAQRAEVIAARIEQHNSAAVWTHVTQQDIFSCA